MSSALATFLIKTAARVGAPIVRQLLERHVGSAARDIGTMIIDAIAAKAGVSAKELPVQDTTTIENAVLAVEAETPELITAWVNQQREANRLMLAEMDKGSAWWIWGWRPAWMWFLGFLFLFRLVLVPITDAAVGSDIAASIDLSTMMTLTAWFMGLYMGGHTVKDVFAKWMVRA